MNREYIVVYAHQIQWILCVISPLPKLKLRDCLTALEREASAPQPKRFRLSEPDVRYAVYMLEKYGEDYKVCFG